MVLIDKIDDEFFNLCLSLSLEDAWGTGNEIWVLSKELIDSKETLLLRDLNDFRRRKVCDVAVEAMELVSCSELNELSLGLKSDDLIEIEFLSD